MRSAASGRITIESLVEYTRREVLNPDSDEPIAKEIWAAMFRGGKPSPEILQDVAARPDGFWWGLYYGRMSTIRMSTVKKPRIRRR